MFRPKVLVKTETHIILFPITFQKIAPLWDNLWYYGIAKQVPDVSAIIGQVTR